MDKLFDKYSNLYNLKYKKNVKFSGYLKAFYQTDGTYYLNCQLIVKNCNEIIYDFCKSFTITDKTKSIFLNQYEIIDIYNDIIMDSSPILCNN
jgi:negative regulator of genetic competence, sporulation and motility